MILNLVTMRMSKKKRKKKKIQASGFLLLFTFHLINQNYKRLIVKLGYLFNPVRPDLKFQHHL